MSVVEYQPAGQGRVLVRVSADNHTAYPFRGDVGIVRFFGTEELIGLFPGAKYVNIQAQPEVSNLSVSKDELSAVMEGEEALPQQGPAPAPLATSVAPPVAAQPKVEEVLTAYLFKAAQARGKQKQTAVNAIAAIAVFLDATGIYTSEQFNALVARYGVEL
jgi:hypothetical protein